MGKIVRKSVDKIVVNKKKFSLGMKGSFIIDFASDSFGPYDYKFQREDCYFNDGIGDRGTKIFPIKNKRFDNTEIFLETDDIVIAVGKRGSLTGEEKDFIDIINIKTEKKYRFIPDEVNLIFNKESKLIINAKIKGKTKTLYLDIDTMEKIKEKEEEVYAFFKCIYNKNEKKWYRLNFIPGYNKAKEEDMKYKKGYFELENMRIKLKPERFDREKYIVYLDMKRELDVWKKSFD